MIHLDKSLRGYITYIFCCSSFPLFFTSKLFLMLSVFPAALCLLNSQPVQIVQSFFWEEYMKGIKTGEWGLTGPCPWAKRKSSPSFVWNPWRNKGPIRIGQSTGEILKEHLNDCELFTKDTLSPTFWIPEETVLQGNNLGYKERRQNLTTIKALIPPHIKVRIIDPSLAL